MTQTTEVGKDSVEDSLLNIEKKSDSVDLYHQEILKVLCGDSVTTNN